MTNGRNLKGLSALLAMTGFALELLLINLFLECMNTTEVVVQI